MAPALFGAALAGATSDRWCRSVVFVTCLKIYAAIAAMKRVTTKNNVKGPARLLVARRR